MSIWKILVVILIVLVIAFIIAWACYSSCVESTYGDVEVHEVWVGGDPKTNVNVLVLGDGFTGDEELDTYRAAVQYLVDGLMDSSPFCYYGDRFNFYRIDVDDPDGKVTEGPCPSGTPAISPLNPMDLPPKVTPILGAAGLVEEDLEITHCFTASSATGNALVLWPTSEGMKRAYTLSEYASSISLIVVVADANGSYGGGYDEVWPGNVGLVVVSIPQIYDSVNGWLVDPNANNLFSHEFAHGLGLLDEYIGYVASPDPSFPELRNVWNPDPADSANPMATSTKQIPWKAALGRAASAASCTQFALKACYGYDDGTGTILQCSSADPNCAYVTRGCQNRAMYCVDFPSCTMPAGCPTGLPPDQFLDVWSGCNTHAGAWEGAYYQQTGLYRSERYCRMQEITAGHDFCDACLIYLNDYMCAGDPSCIEWEVTRNPC